MTISIRGNTPPDGGKFRRRERKGKVGSPTTLSRSTEVPNYWTAKKRKGGEK